MRGTWISIYSRTARIRSTQTQHTNTYRIWLLRGCRRWIIWGRRKLSIGQKIERLAKSDDRHEGRVYWFNTLLFSRSDINRLPSFESKKLARRAANLLMLGLSIPNILDMTTLGPVDFLRALNTLLVEFEAYQQVHPSDGSTASSLSRARIPQMFKRSTNTKTRRTSSAADIGLPFGNSDVSDTKSFLGSISSASTASTMALAPSDDLLPGEEYTYLITPSLPFDPDFFEVFTSLCDVLIDCYVRITNLVSGPEKCVPGLAEIFAKADGRLRKVMVAGIVKEFEDATRAGVKGEVAGIGKVVLGGLMWRYWGSRGLRVFGESLYFYDCNDCTILSPSSSGFQSPNIPQEIFKIRDYSSYAASISNSDDRWWYWE